jgi:hypothetical protein
MARLRASDRARLQSPATDRRRSRVSLGRASSVPLLVGEAAPEQALGGGGIGSPSAGRASQTRRCIGDSA